MCVVYVFQRQIKKFLLCFYLSTETCLSKSKRRLNAVLRIVSHSPIPETKTRGLSQENSLGWLANINTSLLIITLKHNQQKNLGLSRFFFWRIEITHTHIDHNKHGTMWIPMWTTDGQDVRKSNHFGGRIGLVLLIYSWLQCRLNCKINIAYFHLPDVGEAFSVWTDRWRRGCGRVRIGCVRFRWGWRRSGQDWGSR